MNTATAYPYTSTQNGAALVGRILLALIFITSGFGKIMGFEGTVGYIASKGLPLPQVGAAIAIAVELGGGILLAIGFKPPRPALVIAIFTVVAGVIFHDYWNADAAAKMGQQANFWKNISIAGGMLMVFAFGPGAYSVDKR